MVNSYELVVGCWLLVVGCWLNFVTQNAGYNPI